MNSTAVDVTDEPPKAKARVQVGAEELVVDVVVTAAIVWVLVLLGEPLRHVLTSPLFIVLSTAGLVHLAIKVARHDGDSRS